MRPGRPLALLTVLVAAVAPIAACGDDGSSELSPRSVVTADRWERLPDPPLSPRSLPAVHWTGREVLVLGGDTSPLCPPVASCSDPAAPQRDGAAFDLSTQTWRLTAPAPSAISGPAVGSGTVVWVRTAAARTMSPAVSPVLSYDATSDRWTTHPAPPVAAGYVLAVSQGRPVALQPRTGRDAVYDVGTRTWSALPQDPLAPSFDRTAVETPRGLLVTGGAAVEQPGQTPNLLRAALLDVRSRTWTRLPDSDQLVGAGIAVHGDRAAWPDLGGADGGAVNGYGRSIPFGGVLDLRTARWERLRDAPAEGSGGWPVQALGGPVSASEGWLYDDRDRSWASLKVPQDGPARPGAATWAGDRLVVVGGETAPPGPQERVQGAWQLLVGG